MTRGEGAHIYIRAFKDTGWMNEAACKDLPHSVSDTFFVDDQSPRSPTTYALARQICSTCSVKTQCLDYGMSEEVGVYGGLGPSERKHIRRELGLRKPSITNWGGPANSMSQDAIHKRRVRSGR